MSCWKGKKIPKYDKYTGVCSRFKGKNREVTNAGSFLKYRDQNKLKIILMRPIYVEFSWPPFCISSDKIVEKKKKGHQIENREHTRRELDVE